MWSVEAGSISNNKESFLIEENLKNTAVRAESIACIGSFSTSLQFTCSIFVFHGYLLCLDFKIKGIKYIVATYSDVDILGSLSFSGPSY